MFSKNKDSGSSEVKAPAKGGIPSILSSDLHIVGDVKSDGVMDIDGTVEGNVICANATIRKNGHIKGDIVAESVHVYGKVQGMIKARNVQFFKGCNVEGLIMHESITIEDGASVDGRFKRTENLTLELEEKEAPQKQVETTPELPASLAHFDVSAQAPEDIPQRPSPVFFTDEEDKDDDEDNAPEAAEVEYVPVAQEAEEKPKAAAKKKPDVKVLENLRLISDG